MPVYGNYQDNEMVGAKRHVGKILTTDRKCVIAFMQLPGLEDHALVIDTDALPDRFHDALFGLLNSTDAQNETTFANILGRRIMPDTGKDMFLTLHEYGHLQKVHVDNIVMCPKPSLHFPLRQVLEQMGKKIPDHTAKPQVDANSIRDIYESAPQPTRDDTKFSAHTNNRNAEHEERLIGVAQNLLIEAQLLDEEANRKRNEAYRMAPSLMPRVAPRVPVVQEQSTVDVSDYVEPKSKSRKTKKSDE